jgi:hypothetical protein
MKKSILGTLAISAFISLLALAGCDTPVSGGDDNWLEGTANPFIGTWKTSSTNMDGVETITERNFKTDGTIAVTTKKGDSAPAESTVYYLVKDNFLVLSTTTDSVYTKYRFEVIDNNTIKLKQDGGGTTVYNRSGDENPDADRNITLSKGLNAAYRAGNYSIEDGPLCRRG